VPAAAQVLRLRGVGELTRLRVPLGGDAGAAHLLLGVGFIKGFRAHTVCMVAVRVLRVGARRTRVSQRSL